MWPIGHGAVAYLLYAMYRRMGGWGPPGGPAAIVLGVASQVPDLVDKPLSWYIGVLTAGRSLAHSLLVLVPLSGLVYAVARRYERGELGVAFAIGAFSHVGVDAMPALWDRSDVAFLLWPVRQVEPYEGGPPTLLGLLSESLHDPYFYIEFVLVALALAVWRRDGYPGLSILENLVNDVRTRAGKHFERR